MLDAEPIIEAYRDDLAFTPSKRRSFSPETIARGPAAAAIVKRARGVAAYGEIAATMKTLRDAGLTFKAIADALNTAGETTRYGSSFDAANVLRIIRKYAN
jgi:hypothetical protein